MLGVSPMTISRIYSRLDIDSQIPIRTREERIADQTAWSSFLYGEPSEDPDVAEDMDHEVETSAAADMPGDDPESRPEAPAEARKIRMHTELDLGYIETPSDLLMLLQHTPIPFPGEIRIIVSGETPI